MRDLLTAIAIVVIMLLTGALVGPHVVDWGSHRHLVEKRLGAVLGVPVTTTGDIAISLLPTPTLSLQGVTVGTPDSTRIDAASLQATVSLASLLRGAVEVTGLAIEKPVITLVTRADGTLAGLPQAKARFSPESVAIDRLVIRDGRIGVLRPGRAPVEATDIYLDGEAGSLLGPFRAKARFLTAQGRRNFNVAGGKVANGKLRIKALLEDEVRAIRYDLDGSLDPAAAGDGRLFEGQFAASGNLALPQGKGFDQILWRLHGPASAGIDRLQVDDLALSLGNDASAVTFNGLADIRFGARHEVNLILATKQVDLDRVLSPDPRSVHPHSPAELLPYLRGLAESFGSRPAGTDDGRTRLDISAGTVLLGGDRLTGVSLLGTLQGGSLTIQQVSADAPGETTISASGTLASMNGPRFTGDVAIASGDAARLIGWYGAGATLPLKRLNGTLHVDAGPERLLLDASDVVLDQGRASGHFERRPPAEPGGPAKLGLRLTGSGVPLELLQILAPGGAQDDLDATIDLDRIRLGAATAGRVRLHAVRSRAGLALDNVEVTDLAGLSIRGRSSLGQVGGSLYAELDARNLDGVVDVLGRLGYPAAARALAGRASALNAIKAVVRGDSRLEGGRFANAVQIDGNAGQTAIAGSLRWSGRSISSGLLDADLDAGLTLKSADSAGLLAQLGLETLRIDAGPASLALTAGGQLLKGLATRVTGTVAGVKLALDGRLAPLDMARIFDGRAAVETADLSNAAHALAIAYPPVAPGFAARINTAVLLGAGKLGLSGLEGSLNGMSVGGELGFDLGKQGHLTGRLKLGAVDARLLAAVALGPVDALFDKDGWSRRAFGPAQTPPLSGDLRIETPELRLADDFALSKATFRYSFENGHAALEEGEALTPEGWIKGGVSLRRDGPAVTADIQASSNGLQLPLGGHGIEGLTGQVSGALSASGSGTSLAAIVGALAGGGTLSHTGIAIRHLDPQALSRALAAFVDAPSQPDPEVVTQRFASETARTALALPSGDVTATLAQGSLRLAPIKVPAGPGSLTLSLTLDLARSHATAAADYRLDDSPKGWAGPPPSASVAWSGPLLDPARSIDATALVNGLAAISIARDTERIQIYEQDARERAFFVRRQRASDEERKRREEEARKAEEARQAAEAAAQARQEAARKAEEERQRAAQEAAAKETAAKEAAAKEAAAREAAAAEAKRKAAEAKAAAEARARPAAGSGAQSPPAGRPAAPASPAPRAGTGLPATSPRVAPAAPLDLSPQPVPTP